MTPSHPTPQRVRFMESTGVYGVPIFELLEHHAIKPYWVNARHVKTVPGRKRDCNDAQWLQKVHALGLLQGSFRPEAEMCVLRTLLRHRGQLIAHRAPHILRRANTLGYTLIPRAASQPAPAP